MTDLIKAADALAEMVSSALPQLMNPDEFLCCPGRDCSCLGATVHQFAEHTIQSAIAAYRQARESADGVKVKPLVWIEVPANSSWFYAKTEVGEYMCGWIHRKGFYFTMVGNDVVGLTNMKSLEAAKAAAQADYEARIKATLED